MSDLRAQLQTTLGDTYLIERELGGGGMARIFVAEERALGRKVVIKVLAPELAADVSAERFAREILLTAKLQHPQIVPVLMAGDTGGLPFYAMPYVEGESLRDHLAGSGPMRIAEVIGILRDVARALAYAHQHGVVHRDIKPGNVLLTGSSAAVADFGIGKALSAATTSGDASATLTQRGITLGTPAYMAPEQATGDAHTDHRADIYSFGALAYEMLTGSSPFAGRSPHDTIVALLTMPPSSLLSRRPDAPPALAELVMLCLSKDPAARPQSAAELILALDQSTVPRSLQLFPALLRTRGARVAATTLAIGVLAAAVWAAARARGVPAGAARVSGEQSIAVLPCTNVGGDTATEYFVDGITEELIGALAQVPGLRVTPRASAFSLRGAGLDIAAIGARLRVTNVVECTIRRLGPNVRLSAELVDVKNERALWAGTFEGGLQAVIAMQDSIARAVTGALRGRLAGAGVLVVAPARATTDTATYLLYLKGRYVWNQRTPATMRRGIAFLEQALSRDPSFAPAWAELASAYSLAPAFSDQAPSGVLTKARAAAQRAIALDSTLGQAHVALGIINTFYDWDYPGALRQFDAATHLNPGDANAKLFRSWALIGLGRLDDALLAVREAQQLDPFAPIINTRVATLLYYLHRYDDAVIEARRAIDLDSTNTLARFQLGHILVQQHKFDEAFATFPNVAGVAAGWEEGHVGYGYAMAGRRGEALAMQRRLEERARTSYVTPEARATIAVALGDKARALDLLEQGVREHSFYLVFLATEPEWNALRGEPRYHALLRRVQLADPAP